MTIRELSAGEVVFSIECEPEHTAIRGNCSAIDDETDRATERWIEHQLDKGNEWAWCAVRVRAEWQGFHGDAYLGCCSYLSREEFVQGGYYDDMKAEALDALNAVVADTAARIALLS